MDFPQDQIVLFKSFDPAGNVAARYSITDLGFGTIDDVTCGACHKREEDKFIYTYDRFENKEWANKECYRDIRRRGRASFEGNLSIACRDKGT